jgi:hypothetical protein
MPAIAAAMAAKANTTSTVRLRRSVERRPWRILARRGASAGAAIIQFGVFMSVPGTVDPNCGVHLQFARQANPQPAPEPRQAGEIFAKAITAQALQDCFLFLQARKLGFAVLTANLAEFDLLLQLVPTRRVLFYRSGD